MQIIEWIKLFLTAPNEGQSYEDWKNQYYFRQIYKDIAKHMNSKTFCKFEEKRIIPKGGSFKFKYKQQILKD